MKRFVYLILSLIILGCSNPNSSTDFSPIFSFSKEIGQLITANPSVFKTIVKDGKTVKSQTTVNWDEELALFKEAEINFQKFQSYYTTTEEISGTKRVINCIANSKDIKAQQVQYVFDNGQCEMIYINRYTLEKTGTSHQELYYKPNNGYEIIANQNIRGVSKTTFQVKGSFELKEEWLFRLDLGSDILPINVQLGEKNGVIMNSNEAIQLSDFTTKGDTTIIATPIFHSEFRFVKTGEKLNGYWYNLAKGNYKLPLTGIKNPTSRFEGTSEPNIDLTGKWEVKFSPNTEDEYPAIGVFEQNGDKLTGTFLTETGDYRYLQGNVFGNDFFLSCFDGAHAFLFTGSLVNNELTGKFHSGKHWQEPFSGKRNADAQLADPFELTHLVNPEEKFNFSFPNLDGETISLSDETYKNKVTIVQILGSWCPNCMDETAYLKELYDTYNPQGLEMISLCFEKSTELPIAKKGVEKLKNHYNCEHEFLIAGKACKPCAAEALPQLNHIMSFPTTLFIDKKGEVRKIHTGFYGPGTGPYYEMYVEKTNAFIAELLEE